MLLHVAFSQVQHCGRMFPARTPQTLAVAGQVRPVLSGVSLSTHLLWSASWRLCAHFRFLIFTLSFVAFSCCTRHGSHRSFLCFSFCFKQSSGEQAGRAHAANSVTGGAFHSRDESFAFIPYQHPRHESTSFWWWCQSNHSCAVGDKEVQRSAAQPTLNECL